MYYFCSLFVVYGGKDSSLSDWDDGINVKKKKTTDKKKPRKVPKTLVMAEGNSPPLSIEENENDEDLVKKLPSIPSSDEVNQFENKIERWVAIVYFCFVLLFCLGIERDGQKH